MQGVYFVIGYEKEPSPLSPHGGAASTPFLCISYAKRVFDISEWGEPERGSMDARQIAQSLQLVSAACFEMKNHREMRRDESSRRLIP